MAGRTLSLKSMASVRDTIRQSIAPFSTVSQSSRLSAVDEAQLASLVAEMTKLGEELEGLKGSSALGLTDKEVLMRELIRLRDDQIVVFKERLEIVSHLPGGRSLSLSSARVVSDLERLDTAIAAVRTDIKAMDATLHLEGLKTRRSSQEYTNLLSKQLTQLREIEALIKKEQIYWIERRPPLEKLEAPAELEYLQGTVFLWAVADDPLLAPTDIVIGWLILGMQVSIYTFIILASLEQAYVDDANEREDDPVTGVLASLTAVGVTLFLILVFSGSDMFAGMRLLQIRGRLHVRRQIFGAFLVLSIFCLLAASIMVFYSDQGVALILDGTAVLFVADVDERAMEILQHVRSDWRLFCTVETVGLSVAAATIYVSASFAKDPGEELDLCGRSCLFYTINMIPLHLGGITTASSLITLIITRAVDMVTARDLNIPPHQRTSAVAIATWVIVATADVIRGHSHTDDSMAGLFIEAEPDLKWGGFPFFYGELMWWTAQFAFVGGIALHLVALFPRYKVSPYLAALLVGWGVGQWVFIWIHEGALDNDGNILSLSVAGFFLCLVGIAVFLQLGAFVWEADARWGPQHLVRIFYWSVLAMAGHVFLFWIEEFFFFFVHGHDD